MAKQDMLAQYIEFCASPLRNATEIEAELEELQKNPDVKYMAFHKPHVLMIGTPLLVIHWKGIDYEIGEFIIFLTRKRDGRVWETGFRFANVTNSIELCDMEGVVRDICIHPHICQDEYLDIGLHVGELCISNGQNIVYQSLRKGFINKAFVHLWAALKIYGTGKPFFKIEDWPSLLKERRQ